MQLRSALLTLAAFVAPAVRAQEDGASQSGGSGLILMMILSIAGVYLTLYTKLVYPHAARRMGMVGSYRSVKHREVQCCLSASSM